MGEVSGELAVMTGVLGLVTTAMVYLSQRAEVERLQGIIDRMTDAMYRRQAEELEIANAVMERDTRRMREQFEEIARERHRLVCETRHNMDEVLPSSEEDMLFPEGEVKFDSEGNFSTNHRGVK